MNTSQRLLKRQKRKVARAKENVKVSEPDVRTPEQIKAAREASRATPGHDALAVQGTPSTRGIRPIGTGGAAKTDV
jgi:hypothetical protein